ncbi:glia maturation factor [Lepeophtheirus salmonis]|uniref:Glia maturation factor gamma n=1 Tax=Lepeophtheirus salmonis TaxID=72036 RepID=C1BUQ2_LEPSM|nr:glia maturation factor gamma-like [Lepeophtheirus salmonis]ACO12755.1 Glia maturation factor gamma [Lepeophtheirus salmonis]ACO13105.1 Glia maturation factor gamma [Lepeophtheirus salmonis]ADD38302.1 Glia maturation factor gamma [Lepeophtheirus salmonis]
MANEICTIDDELKSTLRSFRFGKSKSSSAIILKIDQKAQKVVVDEILEGITTEELLEEIPDHQPRFALYSFEMVHAADNRVSYPMCLIYFTPSGCQTELAFMYAGTKLSLVKEAQLTKVFEIRDLEEFTHEWLIEKLQK